MAFLQLTCHAGTDNTLAEKSFAMTLKGVNYGNLFAANDPRNRVEFHRVLVEQP